MPKKIVLFNLVNFEKVTTVDQFYKVIGKNDISQCRIKTKMPGGYTTLLKLIIATPSFSQDFRNKLLEDKRTDPLFNNTEICHEKGILHMAIKNKININTLAKMIKGADLTEEDTHGSTPLLCAVLLGNTILVELLIKGGGAAIPANINQVNKFGQTPLVWAINSNSFDIVKMILDAKADPTIAAKKSETPLAQATLKNNPAIVNLLLSTVTNKNGDSLVVAVNKNDEKMTRQLLELKANPNKYDVNSYSPLFIAIRHAKMNLVKILLKGNADPNLRIREDKFIIHSTSVITTLMHVATHESEIEIIKELIKHKGDPNIKNSLGITPICEAVGKGNIKTTKLLLEMKVSPILNNKQGRNLLLCMAASTGNVELFKLFLSKSKQLRIEDIRYFFCEVMRAIEKNRNKENIENIANYILDCELEHIDGDLLGLMEDAFYGAIKYDMNDFFEKSLNKIKINLDENILPKDCNFLHFAVYSLKMDIVVILINHGVNVNALSKEEGTALHLAAQRGNIPLIKLLLEHKADPEIKRHDGKTPYNLLPYHMQINHELAKLFGVTIDGEYKLLPPPSVPIISKNEDDFAAVIEKYKQEYKKRIMQEQAYSIPTGFDLDEKETKKKASSPEKPKLSLLTLEHLFGDVSVSPIHTPIMRNDKPIFVILHPCLEDEMDKSKFKKISDFLLTGHCRFLELNSKDQQGIKILNGKVRHPINGKLCSVHEIKLLSLAARIFGIMEKINSQHVLCCYVYSKNPHKSQKDVTEIADKIKHWISKRSQLIQEKEQASLKQSNFRI